MESKFLLFGFLVLIAIGIVVGCVTKVPTNNSGVENPRTTYHLSEYQLKVVVGEGRAWLNLMPFDESIRRKHISIPVEIQNNAGFNLSHLHIDRAEVIKDNETSGDFKPVFQIQEDCSGKFDNEKMLDEINLSKGCKLAFNIRAWRNSDNLSNFNGTIKVRFNFVSNDYYSDVYDTNEMTISVAE